MSTLIKVCSFCGVPRLIHDDKSCGWKNANIILSPKNEHEKLWQKLALEAKNLPLDAADWFLANKVAYQTEKTFTLQEVQELLKQQRKSCMEAYESETEYPSSDFVMAAILDAPQPCVTSLQTFSLTEVQELLKQQRQACANYIAPVDDKMADLVMETELVVGLSDKVSK